MFQKVKEAANSARLRAGQMWREHRERAEEKRTSAAMNSEHGHGRFFLLHVPALATICAAIVEWYWAILFCIEATGSIDWNYETSVGTATAAVASWNFAFSTHWPVFAGLVLATLPIVMLSMVWLPVQFAMRGAGRWRRGTVIFVGVLANLLVIVSGTVVMNHNRQDQVREAVVVEQSAAQGRAAIDARLALAREELATLTDPANTSYQAQAARDGVTAWARRVEIARRQGDYQLPAIERALVSAERAQDLRDSIERLTIERATAAPEAASAANVTDTVGQELNTFAQYVEVWRPPFIAVLATLIGIFGSWWVLALMQGLNPRDVMRSGWADEAHRIEDLRDEPSVVPQPMKPPREVVTDAETGEELVKITPKPHWRKTKGRKQRVETQPVILPDETGVHDGGGRVGSVVAGAASVSVGGDELAALNPLDNVSGGLVGGDNEADDKAEKSAAADQQEAIQNEPSLEDLPELTEEQAAALMAAADEITEAVTVDAPPATLTVEESLPADDDQAEQSDATPADQNDTPITDERRMIAAYAAE